MISFRRVLMVALMGAVIGCSSPPPAEVVPGMPFNQAKRLLYGDSWEAYDVYQIGMLRGNPALTGLARRLRAVGIVEVEDCDTAKAVCVFNYRRGSRCMRLTTLGEMLADMRVTDVSGTCPEVR